MRKLQTLVVEGKNDAILVGSLLKKGKIANIVGYSDEEWRKSFIKNYEGSDKWKGILSEILKGEYENIGFVTDAEQNFAEKWKSIRTFYAAHGIQLPTKAPENGLTVEHEGRTIGIWIMPNNKDIGYLEYFFRDMIPENDDLLAKATSVVRQIVSEKKNRFPDVQEMKAVVHTWLAWGKTPGQPMGQAITSGKVDVNKEEIQQFLSWYSNTFYLEPITTK